MSQFGVVLASQPSIYPRPGHQSELPITLCTWHGKGYGEKVPGNMEPKKSLLWLSPMTANGNFLLFLILALLTSSACLVG